MEVGAGRRLGWQMRCVAGRVEAECEAVDKDRRSSKADAKGAAQSEDAWRLGKGKGQK